MPSLRVASINMYYEIYGEGEPLLLIMGLGADLTAWSFQTPEFSKKYRVIVFDNRGAGRTDAPDAPYSIRMMADDTVGLMNALGIQQAHVLGVSMGGRIAQELAIEYPQRVKSLILAATSTKMPPREKHVFDTAARMLKEGVSAETHLRNLMPWTLTEKFFENQAQVTWSINAMLANPHKQPTYAFIRQFNACAEHDTANRIGRIKAPALILVGREDLFAPVRLSEELAAQIPNAKLVVVDGGGHGFNVEARDKFNQAVLDFLATVA